jgi:hypothetical protein
MALLVGVVIVLAEQRVGERRLRGGAARLLQRATTRTLGGNTKDAYRIASDHSYLGSHGGHVGRRPMASAQTGSARGRQSLSSSGAELPSARRRSSLCHGRCHMVLRVAYDGRRRALLAARLLGAYRPGLHRCWCCHRWIRRLAWGALALRKPMFCLPPPNRRQPAFPSWRTGFEALYLNRGAAQRER